MTYISTKTSRISKNKCMGCNISGHHGTSSDECKLTNRYPTDNHRASANRGTIFNKRRRNFPIISTLELSIRGNRSWSHIIGKTDMWANKDTIFYRQSLKKRDMILDLDM